MMKERVLSGQEGASRRRSISANRRCSCLVVIDKGAIMVLGRMLLVRLLLLARVRIAGCSAS